MFRRANGLARIHPSGILGLNRSRSGSLVLQHIPGPAAWRIFPTGPVYGGRPLALVDSVSAYLGFWNACPSAFEPLRVKWPSAISTRVSREFAPKQRFGGNSFDTSNDICKSDNGILRNIFSCWMADSHDPGNFHDPRGRE